MKRILLILGLLLLAACGSDETYGKASDVRDSDGWKKVVTSKKFDVEEDTIDFYEEYMENGDIYYIISFATNTTTVIRDTGTHLYISVHEYEDKEEHDAKTIGSGMLLAEYNVSYDGEIDKID